MIPCEATSHALWLANLPAVAAAIAHLLRTGMGTAKISSNTNRRYPRSSCAGMTRASIEKAFYWQSDGLHRTSGLPEVRTHERRKSGKPDLRVKPGNDGGESASTTVGINPAP